MGFKMYPKNAHAMENNPHTRSRDESTFKISSAPDLIPNTEKELKLSTKEERFYKNSALILDSSSQVYSGLDDNSTEPHESLTDSSNVTFVDSYTLEESVDNHSLNEVGMIYLKDFVLIDDDEDGDMSLREKTVTDFSVRDGKAADLVCRRLLSTSTGFDCKDESSFHGPTSPEEVGAEHKKNCCFCTLL